MRNLCSTDEWTASSGYVVSPRYPLPVDDGHDCACRLAASSADGAVVARTLEFDLDSGGDGDDGGNAACRDWLRVIWDGGDESLCGAQVRSYRGREVSFILHTGVGGEKDAAGERRFHGFWIDFKGCFDDVRPLVSAHNRYIRTRNVAGT